MKKRTVCFGIMLIMVFSLAGCTYDPSRDKNATVITTEYYKVQLLNAGRLRARIYGLTSLGKEQEILMIPNYIEGYPVELIGIHGEKKYKIDSKKLKKIYIPYTVYSRMYMGLPIATGSVVCKEEVIFMAMDINPGSSVTGGAKVYMTSTAATKIYSTHAVEYNLVNVYYYYNYEESPNSNHYWADHITGNNLYLNPAEPTREGYTFTNWFLEPECETKWNEILPSSEEERLSLFAGWNKN